MKTSTRMPRVLLTLGVLLIASSAALATTRTVPSAAYPTIQSAEDASSSGDTIVISPGVYTEEVTVDVSDLTIAGYCPNPRSVIMEGEVDGTGLTIEATDVKVRCLTMRHYDYGIEIDDYDGLDVYNVFFLGAYVSIDGESDGFRITNCQFIGSDDYVIDLEGDGGSVTNCTANGPSYEFYICGDGLVFQDVKIDQVGHGGCLVYEGDGGTIERVHCSGADDYGLEIDGDNNLVRDCFVRNTYDSGIYVDGDDNRVESNEVQLSEDYGIEVCGDRNTTIWNKASATEYECFYIDGEAPHVEGNEAFNCGDNGFEIDGDDTLVVKDNTVDGNASDSGMDIDCRGSVPPFLCTAALITGNTVTNPGADYEAFDISGENMTISNNRADYVSYDGFYLGVDDSTIQSNRAYNTGGGSHQDSGFYLSGDRNMFKFNVGQFGTGGSCVEVRGDDNSLRSNVCRDNKADGIVIESGSDNSLMFNVTQLNGGEGLQNGGTDTKFFRNTSTANRIDCADDSGTVAINMGNNCADGSDVATTPEEIDY